MAPSPKTNPVVPAAIVLSVMWLAAAAVAIVAINADLPPDTLDGVLMGCGLIPAFVSFFLGLAAFDR